MNQHCLRAVFLACLLLLFVTSLASAKRAKPDEVPVEGTIICNTTAASPTFTELNNLIDEKLRDRHSCGAGRGESGCREHGKSKGAAVSMCGPEGGQEVVCAKLGVESL